MRDEKDNVILLFPAKDSDGIRAAEISKVTESVQDLSKFVIHGNGFDNKFDQNKLHAAYGIFLENISSYQELLTSMSNREGYDFLAPVLAQTSKMISHFKSTRIKTPECLWLCQQFSAVIIEITEVIRKHHVTIEQHP